ncbi:threonine/serine exporter family protein [Proteiniclasticum sp. SCR006]|uniref:Threonine/serine exporter family protein n=1 Tax=Proteiniclasticum aestuarii TaxID=2817862 RepID=A0A939KJG4_9CLOT|nr:threonine/serine exporter family protein [Proteiniclasticum aestuarii]MBO1263655.1 threonine/serine exporter family protein [Proteiniclasticum aestuarii]
MDNRRLIKLATSAGQIILESGGEIYRVEDTINKILNSYDIRDAESFVTPTGIMVSLTDMQGDVISLIHRVSKSTVDLEKVALVNSLSRELMVHPLPLDELEIKLKEISDKEPYSIRFQLLMAALCGFSFTVLFGGSLVDASIALFIGISVRLLQLVTREIKLNAIFINIIGGALVAILVTIFTKLIPFETDQDTIIIGSIMLLVPGIAFTNGIRDTLMGDYLSGVSKGMEAFLIAVGIAIGAGFGLALMGGF